MKAAAEEFLDLAIDKLDPEMRRNDICQLREAAIQTREALQKPSPSGFRNLCPDHRDKINGLPCLKCTVDRYKKFVAVVVETLDPVNQTPKGIRELREKAIRLNSDAQLASKAFEIPVSNFKQEIFTMAAINLKYAQITDGEDCIIARTETGKILLEIVAADGCGNYAVRWDVGDRWMAGEFVANVDGPELYEKTDEDKEFRSEFGDLWKTVKQSDGGFKWVRFDNA